MKKVLFAALAAAGILTAGCVKNSDNGKGEESIPGSLRVSIVNEAGNASRAQGNEPTQTMENTVINFEVFVFDYTTGALEKRQVFYNTVTGTVTDLNASTTKRVVVLVNYDFSVVTPIDEYDDLDSGTLDIESQVPNFSTAGLFMSGEYPSELTLDPTGANQIQVPVRRVVSKVRLGTLTVTPDTEYDLNEFVLAGVSMQKVPDWAYMLGDVTAQAAAGEYRGGLAGTVSTLWGYLSEDYALPQGYVADTPLEPEIYFYVFPNDDSQGNATMLSISATYAGSPMYYNFIINDLDSGVSGQTDGTYITRNKIYTLNITLRKLGKGTDDPDSTEHPVDMGIEVVITPWEGELIQTVEW